MRKMGWAALCAAGAVFLAGHARADTFTLFNTIPPPCPPPPYSQEYCASNAANGFATAIPGGYELTGPDIASQSPGHGPFLTTLTAVADQAKILTFDYTYQTIDTLGPRFDPGGFLLNGVQTVLSHDVPSRDWRLPQSGVVTFTLAAGDNYGFYIASGDGREGAARISFTLSNAAPIPEPTTWAMLISGFFGLGTALRRRRSAAA